MLKRTHSNRRSMMRCTVFSVTGWLLAGLLASPTEADSDAAGVSNVQASIASAVFRSGKYDRGEIEVEARIVGLRGRVKKPIAVVYALLENKDGQRFCVVRCGVPTNIARGEADFVSLRAATNYDGTSSENPVYSRSHEGVITAIETISRGQPEVESSAVWRLRFSGGIGSAPFDFADKRQIAVRAELWLDGKMVTEYSAPPAGFLASKRIPTDWHVFLKHEGAIVYRVQSWPLL